MPRKYLLRRHEVFAWSISETTQDTGIAIIKCEEILWCSIVRQHCSLSRGTGQELMLLRHLYLPSPVLKLQQVKKPVVQSSKETILAEYMKTAVLKHWTHTCHSFSTYPNNGLRWEIYFFSLIWLYFQLTPLGKKKPHAIGGISGTIVNCLLNLVCPCPK